MLGSVPTERRLARVLEVLRLRQPDLTVVAEDVYKPHNLSAMLRSADAVGIGRVHAIHPAGSVPTFTATSASAERWVELIAHRTLADAAQAVRSEGMQILAAHLSDDAIDYRDADYTRPTAVLFGNERSGVSDGAAALADSHIVVPMQGMVQSLNVSVATAVILFEAQRQRREAGRYREPQLSAAAIEAAAFGWLYPEEAAELIRLRRPFPPLADRHFDP
jgi:tRNA (guanosine-2'-O-)-methyltransferase